MTHKEKCKQDNIESIQMWLKMQEIVANSKTEVLLKQIAGMSFNNGWNTGRLELLKEQARDLDSQD